MSVRSELVLERGRVKVTETERDKNIGRSMEAEGWKERVKLKL